MSTHFLDVILQRWAQERLTAEQAIGHILQHIQTLNERVGRLEKRLAQRRPPDVKLSTGRKQ